MDPKHRGHARVGKGAGRLTLTPRLTHLILLPAGPRRPAGWHVVYRDAPRRRSAHDRASQHPCALVTAPVPRSRGERPVAHPPAMPHFVKTRRVSSGNCLPSVPASLGREPMSLFLVLITRADPAGGQTAGLMRSD
jgi:hypothetical protein